MVAVVLTIINATLLWAVWYFLGRSSIYAKLIKEYREALEVIGAQIWKAAHFSHYIGEYEYPYFTTASAYKQCIPYEGSEHLLGTDKSPE